MADLNLIPSYFALGGVLIGGAITFGYQSLFRQFDRKRLRKERFRRMHHTTADLANSIFDLYLGLHEHVPEEKRGTANDDLWYLIPAAYGFDTRQISYSVDDMAIVSGPKFDDVAAELRLMASRRNAVVACIAHYNEVRRELARATVPYQGARQGDQIATDVRYRDDPMIRLLELEVSSMARQISSALVDLKNQVLSVVPRYNALLMVLNGPKNIAKIELTGTAASTKAA